MQMVGISYKIKKAIMQDILSRFLRAQESIEKTENGLAVSLVQEEKCPVVTLSHRGKQGVVVAVLVHVCLRSPKNCKLLI